MSNIIGGTINSYTDFRMFHASCMKCVYYCLINNMYHINSFFLSNWIFINFVISFQHYPGKVKINLHIPNSSPDILNIKSSPSSISPGGGNSIHIGLKKYSPVNGDTSTSADKKKISISLPLTPPAPPAAPVASAPAPPPVTSVSIYIKVNRSRCNNLGPYLDPKKVSDQLPEQVSLFPQQATVQWGRSMINA